MKPTTRGFSTLAASALLLLLAAFAALSVAQAGESLNAEERTKRTLDERAALWKTVQDAVTAFQERWRPEEQEWVDFARTLDLGRTVEFDDLSARVNLNGVNTFLLGESLLRSTLAGKSVQQFAEYRTKEGPFTRLESYADYYEEEALESLYTTWSVFDVNTVDEEAAERIAALRTGNPAAGAALREVLRTARQDRLVFDRASWETRSQTLDPGLAGVFGAEPEVNVNTAPRNLLEAILTYPALGITDAPAKLALLLSGRQTRPWTPETLAGALGVEKGARVLQYLGTKSTFLQGRIAEGEREFQFVLQRREKEGGPGVRLVAQGWAP